MITHASKTSTSVLESQFRTAIEAGPLRDLDSLARQLWKAHGAGLIGDDQAQQLGERIQQRRVPAAACSLPSMLIAGTPARYTIQRSPEQRSPNRRASITRRREHAATGPLPPAIAAGFTVGELAVLKVVSDEWLAHGVCDLSRNEIGARAGVSLTVVKQAIKLAELGHSLITVQRRPRSGRKHLTNVIRIIRADWLAWLARGRRKAYAIKACNRARPDFAVPGGAEKSPPRSQLLRKAGSDREGRRRSAPSSAMERRD